MSKKSKYWTDAKRKKEILIDKRTNKSIWPVWATIFVSIAFSSFTIYWVMMVKVAKRKANIFLGDGIIVRI